jgi:hypothetical protein
MGIISVDFDIIDQLLIRYSAFIRYWRNKMQVQWDCKLDISVQESLSFSLEGSIMQHSHFIW